jgi:hypothetical protein
MHAAREDAERIIDVLHEAGVSQVAIARLFDCSRKTIVRIAERPKIVPLSPYKGGLAPGEGEMSQILERLDIQDQTLYQIRETLAAIAAELFTSRVPASVFGEAVEALLSQADLERAA